MSPGAFCVSILCLNGLTLDLGSAFCYPASAIVALGALASSGAMKCNHIKLIAGNKGHHYSHLIFVTFFQTYILLLILKLGPQHLLLAEMCCDNNNRATTQTQNACMASAAW